MVDSYDTSYMPANTLSVFHGLRSLLFMSQFTLVGGTALAIQIKHRLSEDLDFISDEEELDVNLIKKNIGKAKIIAVLKFSAITQRNTMRDYYDLYCLSRYHYYLLELITFTKEINPNLSPITYTETLV